MKKRIADLLQSVRDLFFPAACLVCNTYLDDPPADGIELCPDCLNDVELVTEPFCHCCGRPFADSAGPSHLCGLCLKHPFHFDLARAILLYTGPARDFVHQFKYSGRTLAVRSMAKHMLRLPTLAALSEPDLILPVPLHPTRLRERGFNQAGILAKILCADRKKLIDYDLLIRSRATSPQTSLTGPERRRNLKNAFEILTREKIEGKTILLVDDVFTTGATVNECARVLKKGGAKRVEVLTLARVDY